MKYSKKQLMDKWSQIIESKHMTPEIIEQLINEYKRNETISSILGEFPNAVIKYDDEKLTVDFKIAVKQPIKYLEILNAHPH